MTSVFVYLCGFYVQWIVCYRYAERRMANIYQAKSRMIILLIGRLDGSDSVRRAIKNVSHIVHNIWILLMGWCSQCKCGFIRCGVCRLNQNLLQCAIECVNPRTTCLCYLCSKYDRSTFQPNIKTYLTICL